MIQLTDFIHIPTRDTIGLLFNAPELLAVIYFEIDRHEDLIKILPELKEKILSGQLP